MLNKDNLDVLDSDTGIYSTLFDKMPCFVSLQDKNLKLLKTNSLFKERFGVNEGSRCWEAYKQRVSRCPDCPVDKTFQTGTGQQYEEVVRTLEGKEIPVIIYTAPIFGPEGKTEYVLKIGADITDVKRLQKKLHLTQRKFKALFEESPCYISVQDRDLKLTAANRRFKEDFGDELGHHCYEVYKHRDEPCLECPVMLTFEDGRPHSSEEVVTAASGEHCNVLVTTAPMRNSQGEITEVMEMSTNITQIRELEGKLSSLGLLMGSISHGMKGLLTAIDGGMYLVNSGFERDDQRRLREGWDIVQRNMRRVRSMVLDILYYSKDRDLEYEQLHSLEFATEVWNLVSYRAEELNIDFDRKFALTAGKFVVDTKALRTALINILENAFDACRLDHGKSAHQVNFELYRDGKDVVFEIRDNGIGMDRETANKMFTLFFSAKGSEGTGLGLFVSNKIVRQHGGQITVESTPGEGTRFIIRIPRKQMGSNIEGGVESGSLVASA